MLLILCAVDVMPLYWYALHSHPHKENLLWRQAEAQRIEVFYPRIRVKPVNPRSHTIRPYFPGYLFVHADLEQVGQSVFQWMPYTTGLVSFGGEPSIVPDALISSLRRRVEEIEAAGGELFDGLQPGDAVVIQSGPFEGYEAIFNARLSGLERVRVLLKMLSERSLVVELPSGFVAKKPKAPARSQKSAGSQTTK
jgi:transcription antitermination factor NusG